MGVEAPGMRGAFEDQGRLFPYISPEARVPANLPLRKYGSLCVMLTYVSQNYGILT